MIFVESVDQNNGNKLNLMRKLINTLLCFIFFTSSVCATEVVVSGFTKPQYKYGGTNAKLRIYLSDKIVTSDSKILDAARIDSGDWYKEVACNVSADVLSCPPFKIDSTVDSSIAAATYKFVIWDYQNIKRETLGDFKVPPTINPISLAELLKYNRVAVGQTNAGLPASEFSNVQKTLAFDYNNSLSKAISDLGATATDLIITTETKISENINIPENIRLVPEAGALISVSAGQTLTINSMADAGNRKIFAGKGSVRLMPRSVPYFNLTWWSGTDPTIDATEAINHAIGNLTANGGGSLYIPVGAWKTSGGHILPSHTVIFGQSTRSDGVFTSSSFVLTGNSSDAIMKAQENYRQISVRDLTFNTGASTTASGFIAEGHAPNTAHGLDFRNVTWTGTGDNAPAQMFLKDLGNDWETLQVNFDHCSWLVPRNGSGFRSTTINTQINFTQPFFYIQPGGTAAKLDRAASVNFTNPTFAGTVSYASTVTPNRTISQASIKSGTKILTISSGALTQNDIGQKIQITGKLDSYITGITSATAATVEDAAAGDAANEPLAIGYLSPSPQMAKAAVWLAGGRANVTITGSQDEGLQYFLIVNDSQQDFPIGLFNNNIQSTILLNATCTINSSGNKYFSGTFEDGEFSVSRIISVGDYIDKTTRNLKPNNRGVELEQARLFGVRRGASIAQSEINSKQDYYRQKFGMPTDIIHDFKTNQFNPDVANPVFGVGSAFEKPLLRLGQVDNATDEFSYYYDFKRNYTTGRLTVNGNQDSYKGYDFDSDITAKSFNRSGLTALVQTPVSPLYAGAGDVFTVTPVQNMQIDAFGMKPGQEIFLIVTTVGNTNYTITLGNNFKSNGQLQTGTISGKSFVFHFISDGTRLLEVSRTPAM